MTSWSQTVPRAGAGWLKGAALILAVAAVGLPVNDLAAYALLLALAVIIFTGEVTARLKRWLAAIALVAIALAAQIGMSPPRLEEGHNVFLPGAQGEVLRRGLPPPVYARLAAAFDANLSGSGALPARQHRLLAGRRRAGFALCVFRRRRLAQERSLARGERARFFRSGAAQARVRQ